MSSRSQHNYCYILLLLIFSYLAYAAVFINLDTVPLAHDDIIHLLHSLDARDTLRGDEHLAVKIKDLLAYSDPFPPLFFFLTALLFILFGASVKVALLANALLIPVLTVSLYYSVRKISGRKKVALAIAFVAICFPLVCIMSRIYYLDFSLAVFVALAYMFFFLSDNFQKGGYAIAFGIISGLAMLVKWTAFLFLAGAYACLLIEFFRSPNKRILRHLMVAFSLTCFISGLWYYFHYVDVLGRFRLAVEQHGETIGYGLKPNFSIYAPLIFHSIGPYFWIFIIPGTILAIKKKRKYLIPLLLWLVIPYVALSFLPAKLPRYMLPALPALAIPLLEFGFLKNSILKKVIFGLLIGVSWITVTSLTFSIRGGAHCFGFCPTPQDILLDNQRPRFPINSGKNITLFNDIITLVMEDEEPIKTLSVVPYEGYLFKREMIIYHASLGGFADKLFTLSPYRLLFHVRPLDLFDGKFYILKTGRQFYLDEKIRVTQLQRYLKAVHDFLFDKIGSKFELMAVFDLDTDFVYLLKLKEEWTKVEMATYLRRIRKTYPLYGIKEEIGHFRLPLTGVSTQKTGVLSSFYLARGALRISKDDFLLVLPRTELVLFPHSPGGVLSFSCGLPLRPAIKPPIDIVVSISGGPKIFRTLSAGQWSEVHLDFRSHSHAPPYVVSIEINTRGKRSDIRHQMKPGPIVQVEDVSYELKPRMSTVLKKRQPHL